jgi:ketosteroid isomerase-like protein
MKKTNIILLAFAFALFACSTNDKPDVTEDLEALKSYSKEVEKEWNEGDFEGFMALIDDEAIFKGPGVPSVVGIEALRDLYYGSFSTLTFNVEITSEEIVVFGDYAYSMEIWKGSMNPKDGSTPIVFDNTDMSIYKRQADNTWKVWRAIYNPNAPATE